jgi:tRNA(Ile)-lysidine synthase
MSPATFHLSRRTFPSPIGTFLLSAHELDQIRDASVRNAMIIRILRYVSFHPWGSVGGEARRSNTSLSRIVRSVWCPHPWEAGIGCFTAGAGVLWQPVAIKHPGSHVVLSDQVKREGGLKEGDRLGWLATRMPPPRMSTQWSQLHRNITRFLSEGRANQTKMVEILYDCRFLIQCNIAEMPQEVSKSLEDGEPDTKIVVIPDTKWFWPKVQWCRDGKEPIDLAFLQSDEKEPTDLAFLRTHTNDKPESWIKVDFIRTLDAL